MLLTVGADQQRWKVEEVLVMIVKSKRRVETLGWGLDGRTESNILMNASNHVYTTIDGLPLLSPTCPFVHCTCPPNKKAAPVQLPRPHQSQPQQQRVLLQLLLLQHLNQHPQHPLSTLNGAVVRVFLFCAKQSNELLKTSRLILLYNNSNSKQ